MSTLVVFLALLLAWRLRRWILVAIVLSLLGGCEHWFGQPETQRAPQVSLDARTYTDGQLTCLPDPPVPGRPRTPAVVGRYIADLHEAGQDCRGALGAVRERETGSKP